MRWQLPELRAAVAARPWWAVAAAFVFGASLGLAERSRSELAKAAATATRGMLFGMLREAITASRRAPPASHP